MRVLITGSNGFVGKHLVEAWQGEHELLTPTRQEMDVLIPSWRSTAGEDVQGVECLALWFENCGVDAVVHLAATVAGLPGNIGNQGLFMYDNLQMALNVFEAARIAGTKKVINLASVCGYHDVGPKPFKEENFWTGLPHESNRGYGMAKRAGVMLGVEYERQYGMDITNLVPINLVGEYDTSDHVIMDLIRKFERPNTNTALPLMGLLEDQPTFVQLWGRGTATREFLDAKDLVRAIDISLHKNTGAWPINLAGGEEISIKNLAEMIKRVGGYDADILWDESKPEGQAARKLDVTRAKEILRWEPQNSLEQSIKRTIDWYREDII